MDRNVEFLQKTLNGRNFISKCFHIVY